MIPTYNQSQFIGRAIQSARQQSYENIEIIVADDCSTDDTQAIVDDLMTRSGDTRLSYYRNTRNLGILRNYYNALLHTTGDLVINLDGDDFFINPHFFEKAVSLFDRDHNIALVFGNYSEYYQDTDEFLPILNKKIPKVLTDREFFSAFAANRITWNHNTIIYKRIPAIKLGFYWDREVLRNDWESFLRLIVGHKVGYLSSVVAAWAKHDRNETHQVDIQKYLNNFIMIKQVALYAQSHFDKGFVDSWYRQMILTNTKASLTSYLIHRDITGLFAFLKATSKVHKSLPFRAAASPSIILRALLSFNPSLYAFAKQVFRKLRI